MSSSTHLSNSLTAAQKNPAANGATAIFSVDVEDWFHLIAIAAAADFPRWDMYPSRVSGNFLRLLDLFSEHDVRVTCFFLGWIGERFPALVREARRRGHEVASHGYAHRPAYNMSPEAFYEDISKSKKILEDILGGAVHGYRAPGFSITRKTPWFFEKVAEAGFRYDSSVFPAPRQHGGLRTSDYAPYVLNTSYGPLIEFPMSVARVLGQPMCFFGGGYLRLFPLALVKMMARRVLGAGRPVIFYLHPREVDPNQPRLYMSAVRYFKTYVNLRTTELKVRRLLEEFNAVSFNYYIEHHLNGVLQ